MKLQPSETELTGKWLFEHGRIVGDDTLERVDWLTKNHLVKLAQDQSGWFTLFRDPDDGRYWEHYYPQSFMHGGGPPALRVISREEAETKYGVSLPK